MARNPLVYSTRFIGGPILSPGGSLSYLVPEGFLAVVRCLDIGFAPTGANNQTFATIAGHPFFEAVLPGTPLRATFHWDGRQVAEAGESVVVDWAGDDAGVFVSGYLLSLP